MKPESPCKDCKVRKLGCHASCPGYISYKKDVAAYKEREQAYKLSAYDGKVKTWNRYDRRKVYEWYKKK